MVFLFLSGLIIGSFLNVVINRSALGGPISAGRSKCPKCGKTLTWRELAPVLSFIIQKRKCRGCGEKISWQYPIVELTTAGLFVLVWKFYLLGQTQVFNNQILFWVFAAAVFCLTANLIAIFVYDLKHLEIPMSFLLWGLGFSVFLNLILSADSVLSGNNILSLSSPAAKGLAGALAAGGFFLFLVLISKEKWMGQGDIYIGAIIGLLLGWPWILESLIIAFTSGAIIGIILMIASGKKMNTKIPFGPFLVFGSIVVLLWGRLIFEWYVKLLS